MNSELVHKFEEKYTRTDLPKIGVGDSISVAVRIIEGNKERIQRFDGIVIAKGGRGVSKTITVRKISSNIGVERVFLINSPIIKEIKVLAAGAKVRRSKLYYMRELTGKKARLVYEDKRAQV
ncbi:MAG: 50S ribosomal protein L19 [Candidatus Caenarcaniphilales bacterium]|nr:50S ribosomal protein L19 [Candidatus Caenarcaniphilales bacterium]